MGSDYFLCFDKISYVTGKKPSGCILCLVRSKSDQVVNLTVYEDKYFSASVNLYPYNPGHLILFPSRHVEDVRELSGDEQLNRVRLESELLNVLGRVYSPMGFNIGFNIGSAAGASIPHLHLHIIPRYAAETGISDLVAGKRVLIESPFDTKKRLEEACKSIKQPE
jgi:ATP adenylyltransferase